MTDGLPVVLTAPAKLTLSLRVVGVREDGLHRIDAEMVTVDLVDTLRIEKGDGVTFVGPHAEGLEPGGDLVTRALALVGVTGRVEVDKHIPSGAGLGGGSADAAAILRWVGFDDVEATARLGADVPFCVLGGRARVTGVGEGLQPLPHEDRTFTLLTPPRHCATAAVYQAWDDLGGRRGRTAMTWSPPRWPSCRNWRDGATSSRKLLVPFRCSPGVVRRGSSKDPSRGWVAVWCTRWTPRSAQAVWPLVGAEASWSYLPARRCQRVRFSIFLCFFLRMRLRRFLISDPMSAPRLPARDRLGAHDDGHPAAHRGRQVSGSGGTRGRRPGREGRASAR